MHRMHLNTHAGYDHIVKIHSASFLDVVATDSNRKRSCMYVRAHKKDGEESLLDVSCITMNSSFDGVRWCVQRRRSTVHGNKHLLIQPHVLHNHQPSVDDGSTCSKASVGIWSHSDFKSRQLFAVFFYRSLIFYYLISSFYTLIEMFSSHEAE